MGAEALAEGLTNPSRLLYDSKRLLGVTFDPSTAASSHWTFEVESSGDDHMPIMRVAADACRALAGKPRTSVSGGGGGGGGSASARTTSSSSGAGAGAGAGAGSSSSGSGSSSALPLGVFYPEEVSGRVLTELKRMAEKTLGVAVTKAVISVPAHFDDVKVCTERTERTERTEHTECVLVRRLHDAVGCMTSGLLVCHVRVIADENTRFSVLRRGLLQRSRV